MVCIRKFKKILTLIMAVLLLCGILSQQVFAAEPIQYNSPSVIVTELVSGTTILSEQPDMPVAPGGIAKITALYVIAKECFSGNVSLDDEITITADVKVSDSSTIPLKEGEVFTLEQLMYLFYMDYSNTAVYAAAVHTAGSVENFIAKMNDAAKSAGCTNTTFTTITGYYSEGQTTTPADIVAIVKMAIQNTIFKQVFSAVTYEVPETNLSISRSIVTPNLVQRTGNTYGSSYCVGGKQGGYEDLGYATVTLSESNMKESEDEKDNDDEPQMELIVLVAGAASSTDSYADAYNLIQWTFENFSWQTIVYEGEAIERVNVEMASGTDYVVIGPAESVSALVDNSLTVTEFNKEIIIYPPDEGDVYVAPIQRGEVMGELTLTYGDVVYGRVPLVANQEIRLRHWAFFKSEFKSAFKDSGLLWIVVVVCVLFFVYIIYSVLFWYRRIVNKRKSAEIRKQIIDARKEGRVVHSSAVIAKEERKEADTDTTVDEISELLDESVELGDMTEPNISEIADIVSYDETENN